MATYGKWGLDDCERLSPMSAEQANIKATASQQIIPQVTHWTVLHWKSWESFWKTLKDNQFVLLKMDRYTKLKKDVPTYTTTASHVLSSLLNSCHSPLWNPRICFDVPQNTVCLQVIWVTSSPITYKLPSNDGVPCTDEQANWEIQRGKNCRTVVIRGCTKERAGHIRSGVDARMCCPAALISTFVVIWFGYITSCLGHSHFNYPTALTTYKPAVVSTHIRKATLLRQGAIMRQSANNAMKASQERYKDNHCRKICNAPLLFISDSISTLTCRQ